MHAPWVIATDQPKWGQRNVHDEYGNPNAWNGPAVASRFRYAGAQMLPEAQLYYMGARVYDPAIGRFLQTDPILFGGGMNLYAYTANDPVNAFDPTGTKALGVPVTGTLIPGWIPAGWSCSGDCPGQTTIQVGNQTDTFTGTLSDLAEAFSQIAADNTANGISTFFPQFGVFVPGTNGAGSNSSGFNDGVYYPGQDNGSFIQANTTGMPATAPVLVVTDGRSIMHIAIFHMWFNVSGKSTYAEEYQSVAGINLLVDKTLHQSTGLPTGGGNWSFTADLGFYTDAAQTTTLNTVIVQPISSNVGRVVTMYPGGPTN